MIINNFLGGIGNQLFQIAAGYAHSKRMNNFYDINTDKVDIIRLYV